MKTTEGYNFYLYLNHSAPDKHYIYRVSLVYDAE